MSRWGQGTGDRQGSPPGLPIDPLSDLLRVVRLDGAFFYAVEATEPWIVESAAAGDLQPRILPAAEHLISYHILTGGHCYVRLIGEDPVEMLPGDVIVFPHGDANVMSSGRDLRAPGVTTSFPDRYPHTVVLGDGGPPAATFVCGFLGCDRRPFNPLLASLPHLLHMRKMPSAWLDGFARQVTEESNLGRRGGDSVLTGGHGNNTEDTEGYESRLTFRLLVLRVFRVFRVKAFAESRAVSMPAHHNRSCTAFDQTQAGEPVG